MEISQVNVAVVGCGAWGQNLVRNFRELGALHTVCDENAKHLEDASKLAPNAKTLNSFSKILASSEISAVVIATPAETHASLAIAAIESGKDVFVEKPMAISCAEAELMVTTASRRNRIVMVGHLLLYSAMIRKARELILNGTLGRLQHISVKRAKLGKVRSFENVLWSFACHDIAAVLHLFGESQPTNLQCVGRSFVQPTVEDDTHLHLQFPSGCTADIHSSWYWPDNERSYVILGDRRWLKVDEVTSQMTLYDKGIKSDLNARDNGATKVDVESVPPLLVECRHFLESVATRQTPLTPGENGLAVVRILQAATNALRLGSRVIL